MVGTVTTADGAVCAFLFDGIIESEVFAVANRTPRFPALEAALLFGTLRTPVSPRDPAGDGAFCLICFAVLIG
jgi:hypothetical protein